MKITESQLRKIIRSEIRKLGEASRGASALSGASKSYGGDSPAAKAAQSDYDIKWAAADQAAKNVEHDKKYRRQNPAPPPVKGQPIPAPTYSYRSDSPSRSWTLNPNWTTQDDRATAAQAARDSAESSLATTRAADRAAEKPPKKGQSGYQPAPATGAPGAGKGGDGEIKRKARDKKEKNRGGYGLR